MAVSDGDTLTVVKDMGLVVQRRSTTGRSPPSTATSPSATPATRPPGRQHVAQRPAGVPRRGRRRVRARPQRQPHQHRPSWPRRPGCCPGTVTSDTRPGGRAARGRAAASSAEPQRRRARRSSGHSLAVLPRLEGAFSLRPHGRRTASSACATPTASARCASAGSTTGGCWRRRRRRSTWSAPTSSASSTPGEMVVIDDDRRALGPPVRRRADRPQALPVRVRLLRPPRQPRSTARASTTPGCAWASSSPSRLRSTPTW